MASTHNTRAACLEDLPENFSVSLLKDVEISLRCKQQGYKYCQENYIHAIRLYKSEKTVSVSAKCYRSQRKSETPHLLNLDVGQDKIEMAYCSCVAGLGGNCSHVAGLIMSLEHWQMLGLKEPPAELSSTSLPQQWSVPRGPKIQPVPAPKMVIVKPNPSRKRKPLKNTLNDNRKIRVNDDDIMRLQSHEDYPISYIVQKPTSTVETHLGQVPLGSGLSMHAKFYDGKDIVPIDTACGDISFPKSAPVNHTSSVCRVDSVNSLTLDQAYKIEENTRQQATSAQWHTERKSRLTASNFHKIFKRKAAVTDKFVASIIQLNSFSTPATEYGRHMESSARRKYVQETGRHVHNCGLVINPDFPYLGASPDAKVCDSGQTGILEIKCPSSCRDKTISSACDNNTFCLEKTENGIKLKQSHDFFVQVQGQLLVTGAPFCDFFVFTKVDTHVERIFPDNEYMKELLDKLSDFYFKYISPNSGY